MKVNGYTLKSVKMMETPRGISFTGNIYHDGKMIGSAHNKGDGSITDIRLRPEHRDHYPVLDEDFVERLFTLKDYESVFKDVTKDNAGKGLAVIAFTNPFDLDFLLCGNGATAESVRAEIGKANPGREIESVEIFRTLDDFVIDNRAAAPSSEKESVLHKLRDSKSAAPTPKVNTGRKKSGPEL